MSLHTIVLARKTVGHEVVDWETTRIDLGERAKFREVDRAEALVWLNKGTDKDVQKARDYAAKEGYTVLLFPTNERDPLGEAKQLILGKKTPVRTRNGRRR